MKSTNRLNIFVDETGDFGFDHGSSRLYGVSFVFHEQKDDINKEIIVFENKLKSIGYQDMIHMSDLVRNKTPYSNF